ncbi:hypothetical protein N7535_008061 [Penicillium sp. DV-2018c]|nr:hypothetical protein N7461_004097 [Penicillium sp. DV-2018c]KAJ5566423.1 hypothetical protein N7535_008061 [Penicillium sp. DV-2018c]
MVTTRSTPRGSQQVRLKTMPKRSRHIRGIHQSRRPRRLKSNFTQSGRRRTIRKAQEAINEESIIRQPASSQSVSKCIKEKPVPSQEQTMPDNRRASLR